MSNELQTKLDAILLDKNTNLLPENLKAGVTCLGVEGSLEGGATSGVKLFETIDKMNNSTGNKEGDLAIVYRSEIQNTTVDSKFSSAVFPATVVLPDAITDYVEITYRATDNSVMFDCWGQLDGSMLYMSCYSETGEIMIQYESSDGITYTRIDGGEETVDFGTEIYYYHTDYWNDAIGYFIQTSGNTFGGLYQCENVVDPSTYKFHALTDITFEGTTPVFKEGSLVYDVEVIHNAINAVMLVDDTIKKATPATFIFMDEETVAVLSSTGRGINAIYYSEELEYLGVGPDGHSTMASQPYRLVNLKTLEVSDSYTVGAIDGIFSDFTPLSVWIHFDFSNNQITEITKNYNNIIYVGNTINRCPVKFEVKVLKYLLAPTQLNTTPDYVYEKEFYGQNGVETGTLGTNLSDTFADVNAKLVYSIQQQYENMEPRVLTDEDKEIDTNIYFIPVKKDGTPLLDTSAVTDMDHLFFECANLIELPLIDTSNTTDMSVMFQSCSNLVSVPLLNTSKVTTMKSMFSVCEKLAAVPLFDTSKVASMSYMLSGCVSLTSIPEFDTSKVTNMERMLVGCTNLVTIPVLNTTSVTNMSNIVLSCPALSETSLNNILQMCINATAYTGTKTLATLGLTEEQATICTGLSNYTAFTTAGWATGY